MKIKRVLVLYGILGATAASSAAWADSPRYDFLDVGYQSFNDPSSTGLSSDHGYSLDGSYAFTDRLIAGADYVHEKADFTISTITTGTISGNAYSAGLGYRFPLSSNVDLVPNLSYVSEHSTASSVGFSNSTSDTGYDLGVELRAMVMDRLELDADVDHSTPGSSTNTVDLAALYEFTSAFAVGVSFANQSAKGQTTTAWSLALRYYFD